MSKFNREQNIRKFESNYPFNNDYFGEYLYHQLSKYDSGKGPTLDDYVIPMSLDGRTTFDLAKINHGYILGCDGSGKSYMFSNMLTQLILFNDPSSLEITLLERNYSPLFKKLSNSKHVKTYSTDINEFELILQNLAKEVSERTKYLDDSKLYFYDSISIEDKPFPHIFIFIDTFKIVLRELEMLDKDSYANILNHLEVISESGKRAGVHLIVASSSPTIVPNFFMSYCELKVAMRSTLSKYYLTLGFNPELVIPYRQLVYKYSHDKLESYGTHLTLHNDFKIRMKQVELLVDAE